MSRLPSLGALRAFEAAGRHLSLSRAAEELHVTPAAVSHQVKILEEDLGVRLFRRSGRGIVATPEASAGLAELRRGFALVAEGVRRIRASRANPQLRVTSEPTFAGNWLVPRLARLRGRCPGLDVLIDASDRLVDLDRENIDVGIRWGGGRYPGLVSEKLFDEDVFAVCHHSLLRGEHPLNGPSDLRHHTLIHLDWPGGDWPDWPMWLDAAGVEGIDVDRGLRFTAHSHALQATLDAQGVALSTFSLVARDLASGVLACPFGLRLATETQMYLVYRADRAGEPAIAAFRAWILEETASESADGRFPVRSMSEPRETRPERA